MIYRPILLNGALGTSSVAEILQAVQGKMIRIPDKINEKTIVVQRAGVFEVYFKLSPLLS